MILGLWLLLILMQVQLRAADAGNAVTLTNVSEIHRLGREESALAFPVRLNGVVTYSDPQWALLFIRDSTAGVFVALTGGPYPTNTELVEIVGRTGAGSFLPVVTGASWRHLGAAVLPKARLITQPERFGPEIDCEWSELVGVVRQITLNPERDHFQIDLTAQGYRARLFLAVPRGSDSTGLTQLIDARISALGVGGVNYDEDGRGGIKLKSFIPNRVCIRVLDQPAGDPFLLPFLPLAKVRGFSGSNTPIHRVHVRGRATYLHPGGEFVLQEENSAVRVMVPGTNQFQVGDELEVAGFIAPGAFTPVIEEALIRPASMKLRAEPVSVAPATVLWGNYDACLVQVTGIVQNNELAAPNQLLTLLQDDILFGVSLDSTKAGDWAQLKKGDRVRVTGVCAIQGGRRGTPQSFQVLARSANDAVRLPRVRVFSVRQVLTMVVVVAAAWGVVLLWGVALRRRVREQTRELASSLSLISATIESTADGILVVDRKGVVTSFNSTFAGMWHLPAELVESRDDGRLLAFVVEQLKDGEAFLGKVRQLYANPEAEGFDTLELKDGRVFERYSQPQRLDGSCVGRVWCFRDVTARKQAEAESAYERALLNILLETVPDAIYFKDRESRFVRYSSSFEKLFRLANLESLKGRTDFDLFTEEHARQAYEDEQGIIRTGIPVTGKLEKETHTDGRVTWALSSKMPWRDKDGNIIGTFGISKDVSSIKEAEAKFEALHHQLLETSRRVGMAEVATGILHNVGNVLNSVNVSATLVNDRLQRSRTNYLTQAAAMIEEHMNDLAVFLTQDPKGEKLRGYLKDLSLALMQENDAIRTEVQSLRKNVEHIKTIVAMQQSYARVSGTLEKLAPKDLMEDAVQINCAAYQRDQIQFVREYKEVPLVLVDRHKVLQILINLLHNARQALQPISRHERRVRLSIFPVCSERVCLRVSDNGEGIEHNNLDRIFNQGFTTKKDGHGFGLHSGANAAKEMNGSLRAQSDGAGQGAVFSLELPVT